MSHEIFRRGGPHNIRRIGSNRHTLQVRLPADEHGMTARSCPDPECMPGSFKIKFGTGVSGPQTEAYCPYCRRTADPQAFATRGQRRYAKDVVLDQAHDGIQRMLRDALGVGRSGTRTFGDGLVTMTFKPGRRPPVRRPWEEVIRRDLTCPRCTLAHAVYGLAVWCPDCGEDIFVAHVEAECEVVRAMLRDADGRRNDLGARAAARNVENGLEDIVSILEASLRAMARRKLLASGHAPDDVDGIMTRRVRNRFQSGRGAAEVLAELFGIDLAQVFGAAEAERLGRTMEKRHLIAHNLGIVDRKYADRVQTGEAQGRDVRLDASEVLGAIDSAVVLIRSVHAAMFQPAPPGLPAT